MHFRVLIGIVTKFLTQFDPLIELFLQLGCFARFVASEFRFDLRQQILVQELRDLGALGVHDSVKPKVQIRLIELEQFFEQALEFLVFL